jgi:hypothetical protein
LLSGGFVTSLSVLAVAALVGIYILVRKRPLSSRIGVLVSSAVCLVALVWTIGIIHKRHSFARRHASIVASSAAAPPSATMVAASPRPLAPARPVYGHSIVKGGIHSLGELLDVIATDPLAAKHYKGFDITHARFFRLDHNIMAYVSYRIDGKGIYWTSKPVLIMAGEEVITDGTNFIRARCGNMIAFASQLPVETASVTDTDTIVETLPPSPEDVLSTRLELTPSTVGGENLPETTPIGSPPANCCTGGGSFPPIFVPGLPNSPGSPGSPPVIPPSVNVDEFPRHGAFFALFATILLLFLVERIASDRRRRSAIREPRRP